MKFKWKLSSFLIFLVLAALVISASIMGYQNFLKSVYREKVTIDEVVYYSMAKQVKKDISDYNTIPYGQSMLEKGRELPNYFSAPLYKHPPIFTYLISFVFSFVGVKYEHAIYFPLFMGVLMIPLTYFLGKLVYNRMVGISAAIFFWLDPVSTICTQKVWIDTTMAFFMVLAAYFFVSAIKKDKDGYFLASGIASSFALNTKYPGILTTLIIIAYAIIYRRDLFQKKKFLWGLVLPVLSILPWLYWNYQVYGLESLRNHSEFTKSVRLLKQSLVFFVPVTCLFILGALYRSQHKEKFLVSSEKMENFFAKVKEKIDPFLTCASYVITFAFMFHYLKWSILNTFSPFFLPVTTWYQGIFFVEDATFYFRRMIEFFAIYILSFSCLFIYQPKESKEFAFVRMYALIILLFFIVWRNFQSRYLLPAIPFLLIMASQLIYRFFGFILQVEHLFPRLLLKALAIVFIGVCVFKVIVLNLFLTYPNDLCYF